MRYSPAVPKPTPRPIAPEQLVRLALEVLRADRFPYLGTIDNPQLIVYRIRPTRVRYMQEWALEYYEVPLQYLSATAS